MKISGRIQKVNVVDLRVPTSDTLLGSEPFHKKPNDISNGLITFV